MASSKSAVASPSIDSLQDISQGIMSSISAISPLQSSRNPSHDSLVTPTKGGQSKEGTPLRRIRRLPASPSSCTSEDVLRRMSGPTDISREKSPSSLLSLSDYDGSEDSHTDRRFLRHYEELESHCSESFPEFITPFFLRRLNYGPCKTGDIVDLLRYLRPNGPWISPFQLSVLDPYLAASLEKAVYPTLDAFNKSQRALLQTLHHFIFSAYNYAEGIFFPFDEEWDEDRRDAAVDALNIYVEDVIALVEYIRRAGRNTSLQEFVRERTRALDNANTKRTFFFLEGGDTRVETEEYVFNMFLALLGLWTMGAETSSVSMSQVDISRSNAPRLRFDYTKNIPYRAAVMDDISLIRETFGVMATPMDGKVMGTEWVRPLQDFDAATLLQSSFQFVLTRDISRHMALDSHSRAINLFCEEAVGESDCLSRLEGNAIAIILNLDTLAHEHMLLHGLLFARDESRQIAFSLGLVPPRKANLFLRLSAFPNYSAHLLSLRNEIKQWQPRRFKDLFIKGKQNPNVWHTYVGIAVLFVLILLFILGVTGTIGVWIILTHVT